MKAYRLILAFPCLLFVAAHVGADTFTFRAEKMSGTMAAGSEVTILVGDAEVHAGNMLIRANRIEISGDNNQFIDATDNVWGMETERNIVFRSDRIQYDRDRRVVRLYGNSTLEDRDNEVIVMGNLIEFEEDTEIVVILASVRLFHGDMVLRAEHAIYRRNEQWLDLTGFPVVFRGDDEFRANRIRVDLETNDVIMENILIGRIIEFDGDMAIAVLDKGEIIE